MATNEELIWRYLKEQGLNDYGVAGLMGNLYAESGLRPDNLQNSYETILGMNDADYTNRVDKGLYSNFVHDGAGYGLAQWTYWSRKQGLLDFAKEAETSIGDLTTQLKFLRKELNGYPRLLSVLKTATTVREASDAVLTQFERPADQSETMKSRRAGYGQVYYDKYSGAPSPISETKGTGIKLVQAILTKNPCYTSGKKITVKGLMLHSVGCAQPDANVFVKAWNSPSYSSACVHGFIDANDGTVYQTLPWNYRGWHCGGSANGTHIGIEMCEPASIRYTSGAKFVCSDLTSAKAAAKRTYDSAVGLFAALCKAYGLDPLVDGVVISHKEGAARGVASGHADPEHLWDQLGMGYSMDGFRKAVAAVMKEPSATESVTDAEGAINKLARLGVINSPDYWKAYVKQVKYLDLLFIKAAQKITGPGTRMATYQAGIEQLVKDGIIQSPDYWMLHVPDLKNLDPLMRALGGARKD